MKNFIITVNGKNVNVQADWKEQAEAYYRWLSSYTGELEITEDRSCDACSEIYCPASWVEPVSLGQAKMSSRQAWLKNYLRGCYNDYAANKETAELREYLELRGWKRSAETDEFNEDAFETVTYRNDSCYWSEISIG